MPELGWQQFNNLSLICLLNTQKILRVLEAEYQKGFGRNLTLGRLGEAVKDPYCVDVGSHVTLDLNVPASEYIENDIIRLKHLKILWTKNPQNGEDYEQSKSAWNRKKTAQ